MAKQEKVFVTNNTWEAHAILRRTQRAFERVPMVEEILTRNGIVPTEDVLRDALKVKKVERRREVEHEKKIIPLNVQMPQGYEPYDSYENCPAIDEAISTKLKGITNPRERQQMADDLERMKVELYKCFHINARCEIETDDLLRFMEVTADGHIAVPDDLEQRINASTSVYAVTPEGIAARHKHEELAQKLNEFVTLFETDEPFEVAELFDVKDDKFVPAPLNYDYLVINQ